MISPRLEFKITARLLWWAGLVCGIMAAHASAAVTHDFGLVNVGAGAGTYTLTAAISGVTAAPTLSVTGSSFSISSVTCSVTSGTANCTGVIGFAPLYPGLQTGAVYAKGTSGNLLATYLFRGVGQASQMAFLPGITTTVAGNGVWGYTDGPPASASFRNPSGVALDQAGNVYVADSLNQVIRKISPTSVTTFAGTGLAGYSGDNGPATSATLDNPTGVAVDAANNLYIADQGNGLIRRVDAISGLITTVAGGGGTLLTPASSNVPARNASLSGPQSVVVDPAGNLFISDSFHQMVGRVDAVSAVITVYAGGGTGGGSDGLGDGGAATSAILNNPTGLALDSANNLYLADTGDSLIRVVNAATGIISVVAGNGTYGYSGDLGAATSASFKSPMGVRVDSAGNLYIADFGNNVIRQTLATTNTITTLMGNLAYPSDLLVNAAGTLYVADTGNNVIRQVTVGPPALNFSSVVVGTVSLTQVATVLNRGNQPLTLSGLTVGTGFKQLSGVANCSSTSVLQPGGTCSVTLEFVPTAAGAVAGNLSLTSNSLNVTGTQTVALSGTGLAGNAPKATVSSTSLNFGTIAAGSSATQTFTLTNGGTASLSISGVTLTGSGAGAFGVNSTCGTTLAAAASCTTTVTFAPLTSGSFSAALTFTDSAASSPQGVTLSGTGSGGPIGSINTTSLAFTAVVGNSSAAQAVTLTNTGSGGMSITGISLSGPNAPEFSLSSNCGSVLASGQSCSTSVAFTPGVTGTGTASLTIVYIGAGSPQTISLTGTGTSTPAQQVLSTAAINFGSQGVGARSGTQIITVSNPGGSPLVISSLSIGSSSPSFAIVVNTCGVSLAAGGNCQIGVAFIPFALGASNGTLYLASSTGLSATVTLTGNGVTGALADGIYDDSDSRVTYTGTWGHNQDPTRYNGTQSYANQAGSAASFTFTGTQVAYVYETQGNCGNAQISIDGIVVTTTLDEYTATPQAQKRILFTGLSLGTHVITVTAQGTHDQAAAATYIIVDAFIVGPLAPVYDDSDPNVVFTGTWGHNTDVGRYLGTQSYSNQAGATASLTFTGTQVTYVYETQSNLGHAQISIDGSVVTADLDQYSAVLAVQQRLVYTGLTNGVHTITVKVLGNFDTASGAGYILIDAFLVGPATTGIYDDSHPAMSFSAGWGHNSDVGRYNGSQSYCNVAGSSVGFTFSGTAVAFVYETQGNLGHARVSIDGSVVTADIDQFSALPHFQQRALYTGLSSGTHTITVTVLGTQDSASGGAYVLLDAFLVGAQAGSYDDWDAQVTHTGIWGENTDPSRYDGTQSYSNQVGAQVSLTFTGTQVTYVFDKQGNLGNAQVSIDGTVVTASLDQYAATPIAQQQVAYSGLSSGSHTITVSVLGSKDSASAATYVVVDAFQVTP